MQLLERFESDFKGTDSYAGQRLNNVCRNGKSKYSKYEFSLDVYQKSDSERLAVEQFIKKGFASAYGADIDITMPYVLAINNGKFKAALGIRTATENLFIEQYLDQPIEHHVRHKHAVVDREHIAEIGHLYSNSNKFTLPLFSQLRFRCSVTAMNTWYLLELIMWSN